MVWGFEMKNKIKRIGEIDRSSDGISDVIDCSEIERYFAEIGIKTDKDDAKRAASVLRTALSRHAIKIIEKAVNETKERKMAFGAAAMIIGAKKLCN